MLVLNRKPGESIMIGDDIEVTVVSVEENKVKLSVQAPKEVPVYRREIFDAIKEENIRAARSASQLGKKLGEMLPREGGEQSRDEGPDHRDETGDEGK